MDLYFQLLNPLVFAIFAIGFFCIHALRPSRAALVVAASYLTGAAAFVADLVFQGSESVAVRTGVAGLYAATAVLLVCGICRHYRGRAPWRVLNVLLFVHLGIYAYLLSIEATWLRSFSANFGCGVIFAVGLFAFRGRVKRITDKVLFGVHLVNCLQCFVRPMGIALLTDGPLTAETHSEGIFMVSLHLFVAGSAVMTAMALLVVLSRQVFEDLQIRSQTDPLTRLFNRRGFEGRTASWLRRPDRRFSIIVADIDHFKRINDTYGHAVGDEVIVAIANILRTYDRSSWISGRFGGEEFVILVDEMNAFDAKRAGDALRAKFADLRVSVGADEICCTVSIGVAERQTGEPLQSVISRADEALYLAKRDGRNCVRCEADLAVASLGKASLALQGEGRDCVGALEAGKALRA